MPHNSIDAHTEAQGDTPVTPSSLSLASAALCAATIAYPVSQYVAYFFVAIALLVGGIFLFRGDKKTIPDYPWRLLFPMIIFLTAGILFLTVGDAGATHLGLILAIGSPILSIAFSRTPYADQRSALVYSIFIAALLTLWLGLRNTEWSSDNTWRILDSIPTQILVVYLILYFFDKHLYFAPRLLLLLCFRFSFSRILALVVVFFFTLFWPAILVIVFYLGNTLFLLAIFPLLLLPHLYCWIGYFRNIVTRLSLWVVVTIIFLLGVSFVAHLIDAFYTPQSIPKRPYDLVTANGRPYVHDTTTAAYHLGYYHDIYVCRQEIEHEWPRYSGVALSTEYAPGRTIYDALCRYLASGGHRRDSVGLTFLEPKDVAIIEKGGTSSKLLGHGALYWAIWQQLDNIELAKQGGDISQAPLLLAWRSVIEGDKNLQSPIGIVASARRWGILPVAFFMLSITLSLLFIALKYKRRHAWHALFLFLLASLIGYSTFTVHGMFFLMIMVWWALRYKRVSATT